MAQHYFGFVVLALFFLAGVSARPSNEATTPLADGSEATEFDDPNDKQERSLTYEVNPEDHSNLEDIVQKIKSVNEGLKTTTRRPPINYNTQPQTGGGYVIDKDILEKLQQIIATGKFNPSTQKYQESNYLSEDLGAPRYSRHLPFGLAPTTPNGINTEQQVHMAPVPYVTNMPVLVMPLGNSMNNNDFQSNMIDSSMAYQTRAGLPFPFQWPLAQFFPVLIKDPLLNFMGGGGWNNLIQYGQSADVCNRKQKAIEGSEEDTEEISNDDIKPENDGDFIDFALNARQGRALKKRTISEKTLDNNIENIKKIKKIFSVKPTTPKPVKQVYVEEQDTKTANHDDGDLRFPFFGDWTLFGNRKPIAPSPGFFINKLKVRRGGVAIAGPGGVATAGRGGTAIVGPGGLAYTQPGGLAVAGPSARVIALSQEHDLSSIVARLQEQSAATDGSYPGEYRREGSGFSRRSDEYQYNGGGFVKGPWRPDSFFLFLKPTANAINSPRGVAIANPVSNVIIGRNELGTVGHSPVASAVVGPGGIAHAQSDLYVGSVQYLPFYGGAKGQYLEVKKDSLGTVTSEKIVSEDQISSDNILKHSDENLLSKVLAANLISLKTTSTNLLKLQTLGRKTGSLKNTEKTRFRNQLAAVGEAASNIIKLIEEIGDDVDMLFKTNVTQRKYDENDDYIEEEGVGIEAPTDNDETAEIPLGGTIIAEAKPVGLAVIGENGLAASRPVATAVASSGVALARPVATAVAGVDPAALGINFQINHFGKSPSKLHN
ncbi:uncharacterized protein LOC135088445 [Ostrinia nubilalis]|uniref:uncharacterized protein LOC135088445 n=1 Tax=Ostrinia nubilalis TaxID=29057 RepID=UPI00308251AB